MNRIVREHYPVSKLPEDVRKEFPGELEVTLIVEASLAADTELSINDQAALAAIRQTAIEGGDFSRFKHLRRSHLQSSEEAEAYVSALRDEWAHRER